MQRSKIIVELVKDEINVVQAMDILYLLLQDITDEKIKKWLDCEIDGYSESDEIPDYRILKANIKGNYIGGRLQCTNQDIPIKPEYVEEYSKVIITSSVREISQMAVAEKESDEHCLALPLHSILAQQISLVNGEVLSARRELSIYAHTNLLSQIKSKVLKILIELEKKYGNLDNYYIDFSNTSTEKEVVKTIYNIIYTDNSVHIGDKNKIESSNIGVGNEN